jgi:hypothetical protein
MTAVTRIGPWIWSLVIAVTLDVSQSDDRRAPAAPFRRRVEGFHQGGRRGPSEQRTAGFPFRDRE